MAIELGQVSALHKGTMPPTNLNMIWGVTNNNDPATQQVLEYRVYNPATLQWELMGNADPEWQSTNW